jgi:hypothetical protein
LLLKEADEAMKAAEADFARGNLDKARDGYLHVLMLDPNNYAVAVFMAAHPARTSGRWLRTSLL